MPYEGEDSKPSSGKRNLKLDEAIRSMHALSERHKNERLEREKDYQDPEIADEDIDTLTLRVKGGRQPLVFSMVFKSDKDHTAFLQSEMDDAALAKYMGSVVRVKPHDEYMEWLEHREQEGKGASDKTMPDASYYEPKGDENYMKIMETYGLSFGQILHAERFARHHLLNSYRKRVGKQLLPKEAITYLYTFPSIYPGRPAPSKIIEEARKAPAPDKFWLDAERPEF